MKLQYGGTSTTRLCQLTLKFDGYKKRQNHTMRQYLTVMSNMISELTAVRHDMIDEQQVQAMIHSLPSHWEHMRVNLTHNGKIKTFGDVTRHVELEEDRLLIEKHVQKAFMTENKSRGTQGSRCNKGKSKGLQGKGRKEASYNGQKRKCEKRTGKRSKNKNYFNCGKLGHFAHDCIEPKVMFDHNSPSNIFVSSCLMLAETVPFWTINSVAIDQVARDRTFLVEFRRILKKGVDVFT